MLITRPDSLADVGWSRRRYAAEAETLLAEIEGQPKRLLGLAGSALAWAGCVALQDSDDPELDAALRLAADATAAHFVAVSPGPELTFRVGRRAVTIPPVRPGPETTIAAFELGWSLAVALDDARVAGALVRAPTAVFGAITDADRAWIAALKCALGDEPDARMGRIEAATRGDVPPARLPRLAALRAIPARDARALNKAILQILHDHRGRYADGDDPRGLLALDAIALSALGARDGLRIDVRSDYLPLRLWRRREGDADWWLCPQCGSAVGSRAPDCAVCAHDLVIEPARRIAAADWPTLPREACELCCEPLVAWAARCPRCKAERARTAPPVARSATEGRPSEGPLRMPTAATLEVHAQVGRRDVAPRLVQAGFQVQRLAPATLCRAPESAWELQLDVIDAGGVHTVRVWADGDLRIAGYLGRNLLSGWWLLVRLAAALGRGAPVFDADARAPIAAETLASWAAAPSPPPAGSLFSVQTRFDRAHRRAWLHTRGLERCLGFDLEILDVPAVHAAPYADLLRAAAFRLLEVGETLPREKEPFPLGDGVTVCWMPSAWARADAPSGFGASGEDRSGVAGRFAAIVPVLDGPQPPASIAVPLIRGTDLWESRWELDRRRIQARARLDRLEHWRRIRPAWTFRGRFAVPGPDGSIRAPSAWRLLSPKDPVPTDLLDWRIEHPDGVMDPFDVDPAPADTPWDDVTPVER